MTRLEILLKQAFKRSAISNGFTKEEWQKSVYQFGLECYIKALQGKLIEVDYKGNERVLKYAVKE